MDYNSQKIYKAIFKCLFNKNFKKKCIKTKNVYGGGNTANKVVKLLETLKLDKNKLLIKKFKWKVEQERDI